MPGNPCEHAPSRHVSPWTASRDGRDGRRRRGRQDGPAAGRPVRGHGWSVIAVDIQEAVVEAINAGRTHVGEEPGLAELVAEAHAAGRLRATTDGAAAAREADVVVLIVPVMLDDEHRSPTIGSWTRPSTRSCRASTPARRSSSRRRCRSATRGAATRRASRRRRARARGVDSSSRSGRSGCSPARPSATWPRIRSWSVGSARRRRDAGGGLLRRRPRRRGRHDVVSRGRRVRKLADTTYRDVNIALANEFAALRRSDRRRRREVIDAANSQPYSHIHQPGLGVGGHCIPVYPHFLLDRAPELSSSACRAQVNDGQVGSAIRAAPARPR